ncbi:MAG: chorismate mutase / prephenate dehydratase [Candidatus Marinimicrobia bacterium]|jgi:3-deoxy-7-phosphoheptulonate synthase/chorismate mutase|nr:chorismate mutase / prephenate dehydratase [Candidatus Neomarinimicrobiota bacterium]
MDESLIQSLRAHIDRIDKSLVDLLSQRMELAYQIGKEKGKTGQPVTVLAREEEIYHSLEGLNSRFLSSEDLKAIFAQIIALGRKAGEEGAREVNQKIGQTS